MIAGHDNDKSEMEAFFGNERNYIILTNTGKPVFSLHGDIYTLSSIYATLYAMISKSQTYEFVEGYNIQDLMDSQELPVAVKNDYEPERKTSEIFETNVSGDVL